MGLLEGPLQTPPGKQGGLGGETPNKNVPIPKPKDPLGIVKSG